MDLNVVLPFLSTVLSFAFAALVADQWIRRRQPYQLVWTLGLVWYGIGAGAEFLGGAFGWNETLYRAWYAFGAFGVAAYLGLGTIFLLNRTRFGYFVAVAFGLAALFSFLAANRYAREGQPASDAIVVAVVLVTLVAGVAVAVATRVQRRSMAQVAAAFLVPGSIAAAIMAFTVPLAGPGFVLDPANGAPIGAAFPTDVRIVTPPFNIVGAFSLVFGAVYSAYIFMPKRRVLPVHGGGRRAGLLVRGLVVPVNLVASLPATLRALRSGELNSRVPATLLIALGGFFPSIADGLTRFGITWGLFLGQFIGVLLIFLGFLISIEVFSDVRLPFTRIVLRRRDRRSEVAR
ncbi:MAG TPA: hypothetical protein VEW95_11705 [Candidatus Limnocylindrales bacterium]|nr:hypothetical protein [Candidatus Limnocylindrales bacterium]